MASVLIRPKEGILDPQGKAVERALPTLGVGASATSASAGWSSSSTRTGAPDRALREAARQPSDRGLRDRGGRRNDVRRPPFPGSCDERDALWPASGSATRGSSGTRDTDLTGSTQWSSPGASPTATTCGPARSPSSPRRWGGRSSPRRRPGARDLQRLPGALRGRAAARGPAANEGLRFVCRQVDVEVVNADTAWYGCVRARASVLSIPVKHMTGRYFAAAGDCSTRSRRTGRSSSATRRATTRTARSRHRRGPQRGRQRRRA